MIIVLTAAILGLVGCIDLLLFVTEMHKPNRLSKIFQDHKLASIWWQKIIDQFNQLE